MKNIRSILILLILINGCIDPAKIDVPAFKYQLVVDGFITTNSSIGQAIIPAGTSEITIKNPNVTNYTLVYVTPTSSTENNVLFVKSKKDGEFTVGFTNPLNIDVNFNWWIVQVQN